MSTQQKGPILSPSLLSADFGKLEQELADLERAGLSWVHWDVMDGAFVPNITLGAPIIKKCRPKTSLFFDVHLMVDRPERYLDQFLEAGADLLCIHAEACTHLESALSRISQGGAMAALALNPHTSLVCLDYLLPQLDMVLIMSVNPGFGGQGFIPFSLRKIRDLRERIQKAGTKTLIQVDGGVNLDNAASLVDSGADVLVSGSAFFAHPPYSERHQQFLRQALEGRGETTQ
ncbi:MAG: ribulose-phosphate 3-epimerase [Desulfohalobiaceae bacterium]|nr:ribulose-phosphate 3-epimerase [Desulfohalobiaceae bacterium]